MSNPTSEGLVAYYTKLLIAQYHDKPKAIDTVAAISEGIIADAIYTQVRDGFDIETAVGKQLDSLGQLRGVTRYVFGLDLTKDYLQLIDYDYLTPGSAFGLASYDDVVQPPVWYTITYDDFIANTLLDGQFRRVIQFLAKVHSCDYTYSTLDSICYDAFAANVNLVNNEDMTITYQHLTSDTDDLFEILKQMNLLPVSAGVSYTVQEVLSF